MSERTEHLSSFRRLSRLSSRRSWWRVASLVVPATASLFALTTPSGAQTEPTDGTAPARVEVVEVQGLIDPVIADVIGDAVRRSADDGLSALILQVDSRGGVLSAAELASLCAVLRESPVPVLAWVGPNNARVGGQSAAVVAAVDYSANATGAQLASVPTDSEECGSSSSTQTIDALVDAETPTIGDFIVGLNGQTIDGVTFETASTVTSPEGEPRQEPVVQVRFAKPNLAQQLMHAVSNPATAMLLLVVALALLAFELFSGGVGVVGVIGATCLLLAGYGLWALNARPVAVALCVIGTLICSADAQASLPRWKTIVGLVLMTAGLWWLLGEFAPVWWYDLFLVFGFGLFFWLGMPVLGRTRFATTYIDRDRLVGYKGVIHTLSADARSGVVELDGVNWWVQASADSEDGFKEGQLVEVIEGKTGEIVVGEPNRSAAEAGAGQKDEKS